MAEDTVQTGPVTFTPEQQVRVNELISQKQGEAAAHVRQELAQAQTTLATASSELAALKVELETAKSAGKGKQTDDVKTLETQIEAIKRGAAEEAERMRLVGIEKDKKISAAEGEARNVRKQFVITAELANHNFIDPSEVVELTSKFIQWDDSKARFVVKDENGVERLNSEFNPMTLGQFYTDYANKKPHAVKGSLRAGVGGSESQQNGTANNGKYKVEDIFGPKSNSVLANNLAKENLTEYRRLKVEAVKAGLL